MGKVAKVSLGIAAVLLVATLIYLRPIWWETYRYENDRIEVRLQGSRHNNLDLEPSGTLVIRLTGRGREHCGWDPVSRKTGGLASDALVELNSISSEFTDDDGFASAVAHSGFGMGKRSLLFGGCHYNQGYVLILSRPGFATGVVVPHVKKPNSSHQVISYARTRNPKTPALERARNRFRSELRLLYPLRIYTDVFGPREEQERKALLRVGVYWRHTLPDGRSVRSYALEILRQVIEDLDCPMLQSRLREIFVDPSYVPSTEDEILAEHSVLLRVLDGLQDAGVHSCELENQ
jgi:hypothetical protein